MQIIFTFFLILILNAERGYSQNKEVVAEKGDGIFRLLQRHGLSYAANFDEFVELNKNKLGKDNSLLAGVK